MSLIGLRTLQILSILKVEKYEQGVTRERNYKVILKSINYTYKNNDKISNIEPVPHERFRPIEEYSKSNAFENDFYNEYYCYYPIEDVKHVSVSRLRIIKGIINSEYDC